MNITPVDDAAIRAAAMDYAEGWFTGDAVRMERCLHPNLVKRAMRIDDETKMPYLYEITKDRLVAATQDGGGTSFPREKLFYRIDITDVFADIALVRVETYPYVDYLHLIHVGGRWLLLNVLYSRKSVE
jgi:hypothetical protein